jgi:hypothetical protein
VSKGIERQARLIEELERRGDDAREAVICAAADVARDRVGDLVRDEVLRAAERSKVAVEVMAAAKSDILVFEKNALDITQATFDRLYDWPHRGEGTSKHVNVNDRSRLFEPLRRVLGEAGSIASRHGLLQAGSQRWEWSGEVRGDIEYSASSDLLGRPPQPFLEAVDNYQRIAADRVDAVRELKKMEIEASRADAEALWDEA